MVQSDDIADAGAQGYQGGVDIGDEPPRNWLHMDTEDSQEVFSSDVVPNKKIILVSVLEQDIDWNTIFMANSQVKRQSVSQPARQPGGQPVDQLSRQSDRQRTM